MDSPEEALQFEYEDRYRDLFDCYPGEDVDLLDKFELEERHEMVRRSLGWLI